MWMCDRCEEINDDAKASCRKCGVAPDAPPVALPDVSEKPAPEWQPASSGKKSSRLSLIPYLLGFGLLFALVLFVFSAAVLGSLDSKRQAAQYDADCAVSASAGCHEEPRTVSNLYTRPGTGGRSAHYILTLQDAQGQSRDVEVVPDNLLADDTVWRHLSVGDTVSAQVWQGGVQRVSAKGATSDTATNPDHEESSAGPFLPMSGFALLVVGGMFGFFLWASFQGARE